MNKIIIVTLCAIVLLSGCESRPSIQSNDGASETKYTPEQVTSADLNILAQSTDYSSEELESAAKELGYECVMVKATGSRIKKKECTTAKYRNSLEQVTKKYLIEVDKIRN